jgi:excisionase family DNA binding protein
MKETPEFFDNQIWLTNKEAAKYLGITPNAFNIMRCRQSELLPKYRLGKRLRFKRKDLELLIESSASKRSSI